MLIEFIHLPKIAATPKLGKLGLKKELLFETVTVSFAISYVSTRKGVHHEGEGNYSDDHHQSQVDFARARRCIGVALTVENAEIVVDAIQEAIFGAAAEGLKTWLQESETRENTIMHDGQKYQFNRISTKEFQSPFGKFTLKRRLYQNQDGESFIPLDHAWNMENQFATLEVREAVLFALGHMPAREARQLFQVFINWLAK